jgi:hypothetical protein
MPSLFVCLLFFNNYESKNYADYMEDAGEIFANSGKNTPKI